MRINNDLGIAERRITKAVALHIKIVSVISAVLLFTGMIICVIHIFKVQVKHNGGIF